jgi:hypothetical protein
MKLLLIICIILIFLLLKKYYIFEKEKHFMMETFNYPEESFPLTSKGSSIGCKPNENHPHSHGTCECPTGDYRPTVNDDCTPCPSNSTRTGGSDIGEIWDKCTCNSGYTNNGTTCRQCNSDKEIPLPNGGCYPIPNGHFIYEQDGEKKHGYCELSFYHNDDYGYAEYTFTSKGYGNSCDDRPKTEDNSSSGRYYGAARDFVGIHRDRRVKLVAKAEDGSELPAGDNQAPCQIAINTNTYDAPGYTFGCPVPERAPHANANPNDGGFEFKKKFDSISAIKWSWKTNDNVMTKKGTCNCGDNCGEGSCT